MGVGQAQLANDDFSEVIRLNPQHTDAYSRRGLMYTLMNREEEARQDFDRAVQLGANDVDLDRQADLLRREDRPISHGIIQTPDQSIPRPCVILARRHRSRRSLAALQDRFKTPSERPTVRSHC